MYLAVPVLAYAGERTLRFFRSGFSTVRLLKASIWINHSLIYIYIYKTYKLNYVF